jgi:hypothetical protein
LSGHFFEIKNASKLRAFVTIQAGSAVSATTGSGVWEGYASANQSSFHHVLGLSQTYFRSSGSVTLDFSKPKNSLKIVFHVNGLHIVRQSRRKIKRWNFNNLDG